MKSFSLLVLPILFASLAYAQMPSKTQEKFTKGLTSKLNNYSEKRKKASDKYLRKFNKSEEKFLRKLCKINSQKADALFQTWTQSKQRLNAKLNEKSNSRINTTTIYNQHNDTLSCVINYLNDDKSKDAFFKYENELDYENKIIQYERQQKLNLKKVRLEIPELKNKFKGNDKSSYYFLQQLNDYEKGFSSIDRWEEEGMKYLKKNVNFEKYFNTNSQLAALGGIPSSWGKNIDNLQSNKMVKEVQQEYLKGINLNTKDKVIENVSLGAERIYTMKRDSKFLTNSADVPEFKPNPLKTKRIIDRLHYGFDCQFSFGKSILPIGATLGLGFIYDLYPKITIGVGVSYFKEFIKTNSDLKKHHQQDCYLRFYADYKIKSLIYFTTSFERNYMTQNSSGPIQSAFAGLTLKYPAKGKLVPTFSLLYDFLHDFNIPKTQMIVYRLGWQF